MKIIMSLFILPKNPSPKMNLFKKQTILICKKHFLKDQRLKKILAKPLLKLKEVNHHQKIKIG